MNMTDFESCMVEKKFKEKWTCPYCREELEKTICVKTGTDKTKVTVIYGSWLHLEKCRAKKIMELDGYKVLDIECCSNCESFYQDCYDKFEPDLECTKVRNFPIDALGHCGSYKRKAI